MTGFTNCDFCDEEIEYGRTIVCLDCATKYLLGYFDLKRTNAELIKLCERTKDFLDHPEQKNTKAWGLIGDIEHILAEAGGNDD